MRAFLATVLSVIAVGVLLIAYGLLSPRVGRGSPPGSIRTSDARERRVSARAASVCAASA